MEHRTRREFLKQSTAAVFALGLPFPKHPASENKMGIVVHSYWSRWNSKTESKTYPGFTNALELLEHAHTIDAGGIQVGVVGWTPEFTKKIRERKEHLGLYIEGSIGLPASDADVGKFERDVLNAKEAGATVLRTVASSGRRYEALHSVQAFEESKKKAIQSLQRAEPVVNKLGMKIAVENHKDWFAAELVEMIKSIGSRSIGVTVDFGNSIALLEDPMEVVRTLAPYGFSTHVKDMAVEEYADGFLLSEVPLGAGLLDLPKMAELCRQHNKSMHFSLEMITRDPLEIPCLRDDFWATMDRQERSADLRRTMKWVKEHKYPGALPRISQLSAEEKLAKEEENIVACLAYSKKYLERRPDR